MFEILELRRQGRLGAFVKLFAMRYELRKHQMRIWILKCFHLMVIDSPSLDDQTRCKVFTHMVASNSP